MSITEDRTKKIVSTSHSCMHKAGIADLNHHTAPIKDQNTIMAQVVSLHSRKILHPTHRHHDTMGSPIPLMSPAEIKRMSQMGFKPPAAAPSPGPKDENRPPYHAPFKGPTPPMS